MMMSCDNCFKEEAHYHIIIENGKVTDVWYISADGYWDRDLRREEYTVEYKDDLEHSGSVRKVKVRSGKKKAAGKPKVGNPDTDDWLQPKVYKGKSMHEEELENLS